MSPDGAPATAAPGALTVAGTVVRGSFHVDLDVRVEPGEVLGVLGPNGAGKTTLLSTVAGLVALRRGVVRLGDRVLDDPDGRTFVPVERRPVGVVFQSYRLFPHLDVADNVAFAPRCRGVRRRAARRLAQDRLDRLGIGELASRKPAELSGGQAQRVALARALAAEPGVLLLDEPLTALDAQTRSAVRAELRDHLDGFAGPALVVTHDPLEAMMLADRLVVLEGGRVVQHGTPQAVARRPATQYVASLVGLNLYAGRAGARGAVALDAGGALHVAGEASGHVLVSVRPSSIALSTEQPRHASPRNTWPGTVTALELLADRVRVQVDGSPPALVDVTAAAVAELGLRPGARVWLAVKAVDVDVYPDRG